MHKCDPLRGPQGNLLDAIPKDRSREQILALAEGKSTRIERIVSQGQASSPGFWYDQARDEWVALLAGSAGLRLEGEPEVLVLRPGDHVLIPAHRRHRVEWTDASLPTIWLAVHFA